MRSHISVGIALVVVIAGACVPAAASPRSRRARSSPPVLRLHWQDGGAAARVAADGRYAFVEQADQTFALGTLTSLGTLIDERTGARIVVPNPAGEYCPSTVLSDRGLATQCYVASGPNGGEVQVLVFDVAARSWTAIVASRRALPTLDDVGRDWIMFSGAYYHGPSYSNFQNIATGRVLADPTTRHTVADLNAPRLAQPVCRPLSVPFDWQEPYGYVRTFGSLRRAGSYTLALGATLNRHHAIVPFAYLERCGSRRRELIARGYSFGYLTSSSQLVLWSTGANVPYLSGLFLASRRRVEIPIPPSVSKYADYSGGWAQSDSTLYVISGGELLTATLPNH
ncbi:MAG: hypothetical protein M3Y17_09455 [Actinomycetota bacterium]|nr:hypothetical protein [Actinomycetota bacterium]